MFRVVGTISVVRPRNFQRRLVQSSQSAGARVAESKPEPSRIVPLSRMHYAAGNPLSNGLKVASPSFGFLQRDFAISDCRRWRERRCAKTDFSTSSGAEESYSVGIWVVLREICDPTFPCKMTKTGQLAQLF